jgi:hypothetical protein
MNTDPQPFSRFVKTLFAAALFSFAAFPAAAASGASFTMYPTAATVDPQGFISIGLYVSSPVTSINAVSGVINFPADELDGLSVDTSDSIAGLWVDQPKISAEAGTVTFAGVIFNPGFQGSLGKVLTVRFKATGSGTAKLSVSSPRILANDGEGTSLPVNGKAVATVTISSPLHSGATQLSLADKAGNVLPNALTDNSPGSASAVLQALGITFILLAVLAGIHNGYMIRKLIKRSVGPGKVLSLDEANALKRLKKDIEAAEETLENNPK